MFSGLVSWHSNIFILSKLSKWKARWGVRRRILCFSIYFKLKNRRNCSTCSWVERYIIIFYHKKETSRCVTCWRRNEEKKWKDKKAAKCDVIYFHFSHLMKAAPFDKWKNKSINIFSTHSPHSFTFNASELSAS